MSRKRTLVSWSSGKDSSWMLYQLQQSAEIEIVGLVTSFNESADRVSMHAVRRALVEAQAAAAGLPLFSINLPWPCSDQLYRQRMTQFIERAVSIGADQMAFGDLFLEDVRDYRVRQLAGTGIEPVFPIWCGREKTKSLADEIIDSGFKAVITCIDPKQLAPNFLGRQYDKELLSDVPRGVDHCAENGEFHTFCYDGPHFSSGLSVSTGDTVSRDGLMYVDVTADASGGGSS